MIEDICVREARADEAALLTDIAFRSKGVWGYSNELIQAWSSELEVSSSFIEACMSFVVLIDGQIKGFWCQMPVEELSDASVFIEPACIGKGLGKLLFRVIKTEALKRGLHFLTLESDPNAFGFYQKLGAKKIGEKESAVVQGRVLPIMRFDLKNI